MKTKQIVFLVEGETEMAILKCLNVLGKFHKFNIWQHSASKVVRLLGDNPQLYLVFDTDLSSSSAELGQFFRNIKTLKSACSIKLLQQTTNLEDELVRACTFINTKQDLVKQFGASGIDDLKSKIVREGRDAKKLREKLKSLGLDEKILWSQPLLSKLSEINHLQANFNDLARK